MAAHVWLAGVLSFASSWLCRVDEGPWTRIVVRPGDLDDGLFGPAAVALILTCPGGFSPNPLEFLSYGGNGGTFTGPLATSVAGRTSTWVAGVLAGCKSWNARCYIHAQLLLCTGMSYRYRGPCCLAFHCRHPCRVWLW